MATNRDDRWTISTLETLLERYERPAEASLSKETDALTPAYRRWIEASPFCVIASAGTEGLDCSPRGDRPGTLLEIVDNSTLLLPDRRGNNRLDTLRNLIEDPRVALLFFVPGVAETLRVNGCARITVAPELLKRFEVDGKPPTTVIEVRIQRVYFQCARALVRSALWNADSVVGRDRIPTAGEMIRSAAPAFDAESYDRALPDRQRRTLY